MTLVGDRGMDIQLSMLNGWISSVRFLTPFDNPAAPGNMYRSPGMFEVQELYFREVAKVAKSHSNFLGFDIANEMSCCWSTGTDTAAGDAWCDKILTLVESLFPKHLHVNGTWGQWMSHDTFSAGVLSHAAGVPCPPLLPAFRRRVGVRRALRSALDPATGHSSLAAVRLRQEPLQAHLAPGIRHVQRVDAEPTRIPEFLERTTLAAIQGGVSWLTWWASHDVDRKFELNPLEYEFGLLTVDNKIKPQGGGVQGTCGPLPWQACFLRCHEGQTAATSAGELPRHVEMALNWMGYEPKKCVHDRLGVKPARLPPI